MKISYARDLTKLVKHKAACKLGFKMDDRASQKFYALILRINYPFNSYKICLISEAWRLNHSNHSGTNVKSRIKSLGLIPVATTVRSFIKLNINTLRSRWQNKLKNNSLYLVPRMLKKLRGKGIPISLKQETAGVFFGLSHRFISSERADPRFINANGNYHKKYSDLVNREAQSYLKHLTSIEEDSTRKVDFGKIGVLISCFSPERYIDDFLQNLCELEGKDRLIPIFINAGMQEKTRTRIKKIMSRAYNEYIFVDKLGCGIYEAWNIGIQSAPKSVSYFTNFNVDDKRHPLCLKIQATYLDKFKRTNVAITDYLYFFHSRRKTVDIYDENDGNQTNIPIINNRTLLNMNYPHSSPMWRRELHEESNIGWFDESYESAGDAEFWYKVSRTYPDSFDTISIPLSLYYQNPDGISTRKSSKGMLEHIECTKDHYKSIVQEIDKSITTSYSKKHLNKDDATILQILAAESVLMNS